MDEIWKDITDKQLKNIYQVSNLGRIRNKKTGKIRKSHHDKDGYLNIVLYNKSGERVNKKVHRLVAYEFIEQTILDYNVVNHLDSVRDRNIVTNLEWTDDEGNQWHSILKGVRSLKMKYPRDVILNIYEQTKKNISTGVIMKSLGITEGKKDPRYFKFRPIIHGIRTGILYQPLITEYEREEGSTTKEDDHIVLDEDW